MSSTMTMTLVPHIQQDGANSSCPNCGTDLPSSGDQIGLDAQKQIEDLQAQVRMLTQKATAAGECPWENFLLSTHSGYC